MRGKRHYRTATPEQRQIPTSMPIYTFGLDPQTDRGLLNDFFEAIKTWAAAYTVHLRTLTAEQIHNLALHPALTSLGLSSQPSMLVTEQTMLIAIVAAVMSRYIFTQTISSDALRLSNHPHANVTDELLHQWDLLSADNNYYEKAKELLHHQRNIYTAIKNLPTHKAWRATAAHTLSARLLHDLQGLLATTLSPAALKERKHILSEIFIKGYRIGFRLHMSAVKWQFVWPVLGAEFDPRAMVNESKMLYGDVVTTMKRVLERPEEHVVVFGGSPTCVRSEFSGGSEKRELVHGALVHVTRKGWF
jgi:hypothetical protein